MYLEAVANYRNIGKYQVKEMQVFVNELEKLYLFLRIKLERRKVEFEADYLRPCLVK